VFATVVIDIPDLNHRGFDYLIPPAIAPTLAIGCRVLVPLGSRTTQGYVIDIKSSTELADEKQIKPLKENLDLVPYLNNELIELAKWMSNTYAGSLFKVLQQLLPAGLKTKVQHYLSVPSNLDLQKLSQQEEQILDYVVKKQPILKTSLQKQFPNQEELISAMLKNGYLLIEDDFKDKGSRKKLTFVKLRLSGQELLQEIAELSKQAKKQLQIIDFFQSNKLKEYELTSLIAELKTTRSTVNELVKKGFLSFAETDISRDPYKNREFADKQVELNSLQQNVLAKLERAIAERNSQPFLLHGVTGSGKTEIYLNAIQYVLNQGSDSVLLVPEISLTPQMVERFKGRFGTNVAVLHSRLSPGEKLDEWRKIHLGQAKIAIGARSAIFAPFRKLGLIIIDEEHESSYKQEEHPKYHARDIAIWRAKYNKAAAVFGSATPALESYYQAKSGSYKLLEMPNRVMGRSMPAVHLIDMREELRSGNRSMFSRKLQSELESRLEKKEQVVLFLNRRGFSTFVMCRTCGYVIKCPHCEISLTYHQTNKVLRCHYCGHAENEPQLCPECGSKHIRFFGTGTQRVEQELASRFPGIRVLRMDVDTTSKKGAHEKLLNSFKREEADILLGTQMIAKGLDFPKVTLVGVIAADTLLKLPDFRAAERTFQLLTQVSGRAGRHNLAGDVVIQTYDPEHYSIQLASEHDYLSFFSKELEQRKLMSYPPFKSLVMIHFSHPELTKLMRSSASFVSEIKKLLTHDTEIIGPVAAPISRIKDRYRFQCMIKYTDKVDIMPQIKQTINYLQNEIRDRQLLISVDVDPYTLM